MRKVLGSLALFVLLFFFTGCEKNITTKDLKANDWLIETTKEGEPNIIASFSDHVVSFSIDTSEMDSKANEWEALGEEFAKTLVEQMNYKFEYTLKNNEMVWKDDKDKKNDATYIVSKEKKDLILAPDKNNKSDNKEKLILKPYTKRKTIKSTKSTSSSSNKKSSSTTKASTSTAFSTKESTTEISTVATTNDYQAILNEYTTSLQSSTPSLIEEFRSEAANNTSGVDGLAAISNNKVEKLAMISTEGMNQMANYHYSISDNYATYESWASKLTDVYTTESQKIISEYLAYSMTVAVDANDKNTEQSVQQDYASSSKSQSERESTSQSPQTEYESSTDTGYEEVSQSPENMSAHTTISSEPVKVQNK
ncbi:hypothetical protein [Enterococcus thailandicus]|uniref:hypothetical protein n=1 Tax=Enterococcus thailandicus TaxID=417368 RepID=UPI001FD2C783|nr:hypothetical protein [Enterococcus thailandicus]